MGFKFNNSKMDELFREIILNDEGVFQYALLRKQIVKDPDTLSIKEVMDIWHSGMANWNHPEERISYEMDGVMRDVSGIVFVPKPSDAKKTDVVYNMATDQAYRVMGTVNYSSHMELHVEEYSLGTNFTLPSIPSPTPYLSGDAEVV